MAEPQLHLEYHGAEARKRLAFLLAEAKSEDPLAPVTVVVPTQYTGLSLRRSLASTGGLVNVRFMVPSRLAEYLGAPSLAAQDKVPLSPLVELAAIRAGAPEMAGHEPLDPLAHHPGLHRSLRNTFRDLARLSAQGLQRLDEADPLRAQIVRWYRLTKEHLSHTYNREELAQAAAAAVGEGRAASALWDLGLVVFYLVQDITPGETSLIEALGGEGMCAVVLGLVGEDDADASAQRLAARLASTFGPRPTRDVNLHPEVAADHLVSAPNAHEEVQWIVRHIAHKAERGLPFHRMAVLYRQADPYGYLVPSLLRMATIPVAGPDPRPLRDSPAGKLLTMLLTVVESDFSRESVMEWIAEAPVKGDNGTPASAELGRWETVSREAGIVGGISQWTERLGRHRGHVSQRIEKLERLEETTPAILSGLRELVSSSRRLESFIKKLEADAPPPQSDRWRDHARWAERLLKKYAFNPERWPEEHRDSYDQVLAKLDDISGLDTVAGHTDLAGFRLMFSDALESSSGRLGKVGEGVFVGPVASAQGMDFDVVHLVGVAEGAFPPRVAEDPMLPDHIRKALGGARALPLREDRSVEERRLFLSALAAGGQRVLSYPRGDTSGQRAQYPSVWLLEAAEHAHGGPVSSTDLTRHAAEGWLTVVESSEHGLEHAGSLAPADAHDYDVASVARWRAGGRRLGDHPLLSEGETLDRALRMEQARRSDRFTAWDGRLSELAGKSPRLPLPSEIELSPTRLERWATCPYRYFLADVLGLSALESPEEMLAISPLDRGTLIHRILERFVEAATKRGQLPGYGEPWREDHQGLLMEIAEEEFKQAEAQGITGRKLIWEVVKDEIRDDLASFLEYDSRWRAEHGSRPMWVERSFGFGTTDSLPAVPLELPNGDLVRFRGLIDRVDTDQSGSRTTVIDYKSGRTDSYDDMRRDPLGAGRHLQLPVYAMAVRSLQDGAQDVEGQYWFVSAQGKFDRKAIRLADVESHLKEVVGTIASGIERGLFPANPGAPGLYGSENCKFCDFDRVCPSNRDALWTRKRGDPDLAGYVELTEG